jgi:pimeloyl-ACP methyl ester carboxylesterase
VRERAVTFGATTRLAGVIGDPDGKANDIAFIFLNAGVVHRVGPNRLYVRLARALTEAGFVTMRFDFSGLGDSDPRSDLVPSSESSIFEAREAIELLVKTRGIQRVVLAGICSGAAMAFLTALVDPRVVGAVMIDSPAYPTRKFHARYFAGRLFQTATWLNTVQGRNGTGRRIYRALGLQAPPRTDEEELADARGSEHLLARDAVVGQLNGVIARGCRLCLVFSGGQKTMNYENQVRESLPEVRFGTQLTVHYFPECDHTFTRLPHQRRLTEAIVSWAGVNFKSSFQSEVTEPRSVVTPRASAAGNLSPR